MPDNYPSIDGASISVPNLVTQLNTDTGPQASASDFAPNASGLAQGIGEAAQGLGNIADQEQRKQHATDSLWALNAADQADKDWTSKIVAAQANGTPFDPEQFDAQYQQDVGKRLQSAPTDGARLIAERQMTRQGLTMFKQNVGYNAQFAMQTRQAQATALAAGIEERVRTGAMTPDDGMAAIVNLNKTVAPVVPGMSAVASDAQAGITQTKMVQVGQTLGPGALAQQIRSDGLGAPFLPPTAREIVATQADNKQAVDIATRVSVAQKQLSQLQASVANGGSVTPQQWAQASSELAAAKTAQPITSNAPPLADVFSASIDKWDAALGSASGPFSRIQAASLKNIEIASLGRLGQQRLLGMNPVNARMEINQLQDRFGVGDDAGGTLVRHLALQQQQIESSLDPAKPSFDPASVAMRSPDVQAQMQAAIQARSVAVSPQDKGSADQAMNLAIQSSFTIQRQMGVQERNLRVMTNDQAAQYGGRMQSPADYQKTFGDLQTTFGPDYSEQAIRQVADVKGQTPGSIQLAMLAPNTQANWAAASFAEKPDDATAKLITTAVGNNSDFQKYVASNQADLRNAQQTVDYTKGFEQQVYYRMKQYGQTPDQAMTSAYQDTVGQHYTITKTDGTLPAKPGLFGTGIGGQSRTLALPTSIAPNPTVATDIQHKANIAMTQIQSLGSTIQDTSGAPIDDATKWKAAFDKGYWVYDNHTQALTRYINGPLGDQPVTLSDGRPLSFSASGLKASNTVVPRSYYRVNDADPTMHDVPTDPTEVHALVQDHDVRFVYRPVKLDSDINSLIPAADVAPVPGTPILQSKQPVAPGQPQASFQDKLPPAMQSLAPLFQKYGQENGIDPRLLAAISMHETGRGTSKAFRQGNNAMGVSNSKGPIAFSNVEDSIAHQAHTLGSSPLYAKFRQTGNISDLGATYAPVGASNDPGNQNPDWVGGVSSLYQGLM